MDNNVKLGLNQPGHTCNECRWKTERNECPEGFDYEWTNYAEDCDNFRNVKFEETAFSEGLTNESK